MICKLIACGVDRSAAIATMREALNGFVIRGVSSNLAFQAALLGHPRFAAGDFDTGFIAEEFAQGFDPAAIDHRIATSCSRSPLPTSAACWRDRPG
jgi:propionyl-CoA carboxylase alpha chain